MAEMALLLFYGEKKNVLTRFITKEVLIFGVLNILVNEALLLQVHLYFAKQ
jgi:hypothetical protein